MTNSANVMCNVILARGVSDKLKVMTLDILNRATRRSIQVGTDM